ncbi:MAG: CapA family protein [Nocardioidaceae bacterium]
MPTSLDRIASIRHPSSGSILRMHTPGRTAIVAAITGLACVLAACGGDDSPDAGGETTTTRYSTEGPGQTSQPPTTTPTTAPTTTQATPDPPSRPITIAFAGDVHFESFLAATLAHPRTAMGPMARLLANADLSIVNLETAITTRGTPEPKEFRFHAPPSALVALKAAGVDVATMANNHGLDYGPVSVPDALVASAAVDMPVIGIGRDAARAYAPWIVTSHGQRVAFLAATAVMDPPLVDSWSATATQPGLATALDGDNARIVAAVKKVRPHVDTVVVDLHYGSDLLTCPTEIQRNLADDLVAAGADVVVGQHAHVVLGGGYLGSAYVDFGLGNFQFYVSNDSPTSETGVLVLTVDGRTVTHPRWVPGQIVNGLPTALAGGEAAAAHDHWASLRACGGLTDRPTR